MLLAQCFLGSETDSPSLKNLKCRLPICVVVLTKGLFPSINELLDQRVLVGRNTSKVFDQTGKQLYLTLVRAIGITSGS